MSFERDKCSRFLQRRDEKLPIFLLLINKRTGKHRNGLSFYSPIADDYAFDGLHPCTRCAHALLFVSCCNWTCKENEQVWMKVARMMMMNRFWVSIETESNKKRRKANQTNDGDDDDSKESLIKMNHPRPDAYSNACCKCKRPVKSDAPGAEQCFGCFLFWCGGDSVNKSS